MSDGAADSNPVVLVEADQGALNELARRIRLQGAEPLQALSTAEAASLLPIGHCGVGAILIDAALASRGLKKDLSRLRTAADSLQLHFVAVGDKPVPAERRRLRSAGIRLALWRPFDDTTLRFQLNRAWHGDRDSHKRQSPRIPTYLHAQIGGGQRIKDGVVYSLSVEGAFIETPRASMAGANVELAIRLPACFVEARARVVFANVPGNLQRPNLPLGMAVRFEEIDSATAKHLKSYVKHKLADLEV